MSTVQHLSKNYLLFGQTSVFCIITMHYVMLPKLQISLKVSHFESLKDIQSNVTAALLETEFAYEVRQ